MKIAIAADHAGFELKDHLGRWLADEGHEVVDLGTDGPESVDYPDFGHRLAEEVLAGDCERGVLVCGTGVGVAMTANRHAGIRAVNSLDLYSVRMARAHNDANVLCLGARVIGTGLAEALLETFLVTAFDGGRHARRIDKIELDS